MGKGLGGSKRRPPLSPIEVEAFTDRVRFCHGEDRLSQWEAGFINSMKYWAYNQASWKLPEDREPIWITDKQAGKLKEILDKLHFDHPNLPLPGIDQDGIGDPDGVADPDGVNEQSEHASADYFDENDE